jgi:hypothetical protein
MVGSLKDLWKNPVARYSTMGSSFRFVASLACDYFLPAYFLMNFPNYTKQFSVGYAFCVA